MTLTVLDRDAWIVTVDAVLTPEECRSLIALVEGIGFDAAPITVAGGFLHAPEFRNNTRVMLDDPERAAWLWERVRAHVPLEREKMTAVGLNERFRFYRYEPGQFFRWHMDGEYERSSRERSLLTLMVYLNGDVDGGATDFRGLPSVVPETGKALLFQHAVLHQGAPVERGRKYVLRSDVMYRER